MVQSVALTEQRNTGAAEDYEPLVEKIAEISG
jgi:hypothetical protein